MLCASVFDISTIISKADLETILQVAFPPQAEGNTRFEGVRFELPHDLNAIPESMNAAWDTR